MKFMGLLAVSLATASAQSDVGKLIFQGAADAAKLFEPIPEGDKSAILTCAAELLKKHVTFRPDGTPPPFAARMAGNTWSGNASS